MKYFWKTVGNTGAKIYEQCRGTSYADYKPGCYYISPYEVLNKEECLERGLSWKEEFLPLSIKASPLKEEKKQRKALAQKEEIIENANKVSKEICTGTHEYANAILEKVEDVLKETLEVVQNNRRELN